METSALPSLFLASQSPRRRELLTQIGVPFQALSVSVEEVPCQGERPADYVQRLALEKAQAGVVVLSAGQTQMPVLGADTIVLCEGQILEKPRDQVHALEMLMRLSGVTHQVLSAVSVVSGDRQLTRLSVTDVTFREITQREAENYWLTGEPLDKAGGYAIQGLGAVFVQRLSGSYSGVVGLPIECVVELLPQFNVPVWQCR